MDARIGVAGLDENRRLEQAGAALGIVSDGRGNRWEAAKYGIAGVDHQGKWEAARCGLAGVNTRPIQEAGQHACFGAAGTKDASTIRPVAQAGVAGNLGSTIRPELPDMLRPPTYTSRQRLGDQAAQIGHRYGVYFADYTYVVKARGQQWRHGREQVFGPDRLLPLWFDSGAYRIWTGTAPRWASMDSYLAAIELCQPDGYCSYDVIGDQAQSLRNYEAMKAMGYEPFPVYHVRPRWSDEATVSGLAYRNIQPAARLAIANARIAVADPVMRYYASKSELIGLGGMVRGPIPRDVRHYYIAELCRLYPDHQFWALGQANFKVVNGLGAMGLLPRVWTDGSWWILDAACERFAVVMDGQIVMHSLEGIARSFFTITECMAANLRSLLGAYAGLWLWPPPDPLPLDPHDEGQVVEMKTRLAANQLELFGPGKVKVMAGCAVVEDEP